MQKTLPFEAKVLIDPFNSLREDFTPTAGLLKITENQQLTLTNASGEVLINKPLNELKRVSKGSTPGGRVNTSVRIYVGQNEAYAVAFSANADNPAQAGADMLASVQQGDFAKATEVFKNNLADNNDIKKAGNEALSQRDFFITLAKQAGVYKSNSRSLVGVMFIAVAIIFAVLVFVIVSG